MAGAFFQLPMQDRHEIAPRLIVSGQRNRIMWHFGNIPETQLILIKTMVYTTNTGQIKQLPSVDFS